LPVKKKLIPGAQGTKRFLQQFGERLVCVRYRYDEAMTRRYTTIEVIVDEKDLPGGYNPLLQPRRHPNTIVSIRVGYEEFELRGQIRQAGGRWDPNSKLWRLPYYKAAALALLDRMVENTGG